MPLREKINQQFNAALKNKNKTLISTLRLILAAIKERDIANRAGGKKEEVKDQEIIESIGASSVKDMGKIMGTLKKKYSDSIDFSKANIIIKGLLN